MTWKMLKKGAHPRGAPCTHTCTSKPIFPTKPTDEGHRVFFETPEVRELCWVGEETAPPCSEPKKWCKEKLGDCTWGHELHAVITASRSRSWRISPASSPACYTRDDAFNLLINIKSPKNTPQERAVKMVRSIATSKLTWKKQTNPFQKKTCTSFQSSRSLDCRKAKLCCSPPTQLCLLRMQYMYLSHFTLLIWAYKKLQRFSLLSLAPFFPPNINKR